MYDPIRNDQAKIIDSTEFELQLKHFVSRLILYHYDVIKWKHLPRYWMALCAGNSPVTGEFPSQRPVTRSFDVFFDLRLNKGLK